MAHSIQEFRDRKAILNDSARQAVRGFGETTPQADLNAIATGFHATLVDYPSQSLLRAIDQLETLVG